MGTGTARMGAEETEVAGKDPADLGRGAVAARRRVGAIHTATTVAGRQTATVTVARGGVGVAAEAGAAGLAAGGAATEAAVVAGVAVRRGGGGRPSRNKWREGSKRSSVVLGLS